MPIYLKTKDVLNVPASCFANYDTPANPKPVNLLTWLRSDKHRAKVETLRSEPDKTRRDALKATLPAITPSGLFTYRKESRMIPGSHTRLLQFDIDLKENQRITNYTDLKGQICKLPFVAYCGLSASGKGIWGLVPIANPERHSEHFNALVRVFAHYGIILDPAPRNVASLRGYSYDPAPYLPEKVMEFTLYDYPTKPTKPPFSVTADAGTDRERVEVCISEVNKRATYIGDTYADWYTVGCSLANGFGESGRDYFRQISQHYPDYRPNETDKQFTACLRVNSKATLGTFFKFCADAGIEWKELMPNVARPDSPPQRPHPVSDARPNNTWLRDGQLLHGVPLDVEPAADYPATWDTPNEPDAVPTIRQIHVRNSAEFFRWQRDSPPFNAMGLASLKPP